jgi:hypothetical protein
MSRTGKILLGSLSLMMLAAAANAQPVNFEAAVSQKEAIRLDFSDASKRFFLMVRREGKTEGHGPLAGASVQEYGAHDVVPGKGGEPHGYLEFSGSDGSKAYLKWQIQAVFLPGTEGKPRLVDHGVWRVVGGTGKWEKLQGAGTFRLQFPGPADRRFVLQGEFAQP